MADEETAEERDERIRTAMRAEANALAHAASPQAGNELDDDSDDRKAKKTEARRGQREAEKKK